MLLGIYCHSDGYLMHNGGILLDHYNTPEKVDELISLGALSYLGESLNPDPSKQHDFLNRQPGVCVAYGRDRGEDHTEAEVLTIDKIKSLYPWVEYIYVFDKKWKVGYLEQDKETKLKNLETSLNRLWKRQGYKERIKGYYNLSQANLADLKQNEIEPPEM